MDTPAVKQLNDNMNSVNGSLNTVNDSPNTANVGVNTANNSVNTTDKTVSLKFDRRRDIRYPVSGQITILRCDHDPEVYQHPVAAMQLSDMSDGGLAATSDTTLSRNERVTVYFPPKGDDPGFDLYGHIVRCIPAQNGYAIAIQFDAKRPA